MAEETVAALLIRRLREQGVSRVFGVPGDYSFGVCDAVEADPQVRWVGCANELNAGYAADGWARIHGLGVLQTTYGVGELSAINAVAGAFSERVEITCTPSTGVRANQNLIVHHTLNVSWKRDHSYDVFLDMHRGVTCAQAALTPENAAAEIERVLSECVRLCLPVYFSIPAEVCALPAARPASGYATGRILPLASDPEALSQAIRLISDWANAAERPVILADLGVYRAKAHAELRALVEATNYPCATLLHGRGALDEHHPNHIGVYTGGHSYPQSVVSVVESSDCLICVGSNLTDFTTGGFTAHLPESLIVDVKLQFTKVKKARFDDVRSIDVLRELPKALRRRESPGAATPGAPTYWAPRPASDGVLPPAPGGAAAKLTADGFLAQLQRMLKPGDLLVMETGTLSFGSAAMRLPAGVTYMTQALWGSIGYATPAAFGAAAAAEDSPGGPVKRVVLVTGEGSLQLVAQELGNALRDGIAPICFVLNNGGYLIERVLCNEAGCNASYNDVPAWRYDALPYAFGGEEGRYFSAAAATEGELSAAIAQAEAAQEGGKLAWVELRTDRLDVAKGCRWLSKNSLCTPEGHAPFAYGAIHK